MSVREGRTGLLRSCRRALKVFAYMHMPGLADLIAQHRTAGHTELPAKPIPLDDADLIPAERYAH